MVHGFGHGQKQLKRCFGKGASDTQLITKVLVDPLMGGTGMRSNFVTFVTEGQRRRLHHEIRNGGRYKKMASGAATVL